MAWWNFWTQARSPHFEPQKPLPNPEARPVEAFLTATWLAEWRPAEGTLETLRLSRALLGDPSCHMDALKALWRRLGPVLDSKQLMEEAALAPGVLGKLLGQGAEAVRARPDQAEGFRLFLRAVLYAYRFHANLFGLRHRLEAGQPVQGRAPAPTALHPVWVQTYQRPMFTFVGAQIPDAWLRPPEIQRLSLSHGDLLLTLRTSLAQGLPAACSTDGQCCGLIAALSGKTRGIGFDPVSGRSHSVELETLTEISVAAGDRTFLDDLYAEPALL